MDEKKFIISGTTSVGLVPTTGSFSLLNGVANGDDYTNRTGRVIFMNEGSIHLSFQPDSTGNSPIGDTIRCIFFVDLQSNGTTPSTTALLDTANFTSHFNEDYSERFEILEDFTIDLPANSYTAGALATGDPTPRFRYVDLALAQKVIFNSTAATAAAITTGSLWFFCISLSGTYSVTYNSKINFFDD